MADIDPIANGEAALSVRAKLNELIARSNACDSSVEAGEPLQAGQPVRITMTRLAMRANASAPNTATVIGLVKADTATGVGADIARCSLTLTDWTAVVGAAALTPAAFYYLGTTSGTLTTVAPDATGQALVRVGVALDSQTLFINPTPMVVL